ALRRDHLAAGARRVPEQPDRAAALLLCLAVEIGDERRPAREVEVRVLRGDLLETPRVPAVERERAVRGGRGLAPDDDLAGPLRRLRERGRRGGDHAVAAARRGRGRAPPPARAPARRPPPPPAAPPPPPHAVARKAPETRAMTVRRSMRRI